jgi:hypothetical protein
MPSHRTPATGTTSAILLHQSKHQCSYAPQHAVIEHSYLTLGVSDYVAQGCGSEVDVLEPFCPLADKRVAVDVLEPFCPPADKRVAVVRGHTRAHGFSRVLTPLNHNRYSFTQCVTALVVLRFDSWEPTHAWNILSASGQTICHNISTLTSTLQVCLIQTPAGHHH